MKTVQYRREHAAVYCLVDDPPVGIIPMCHEELICLCVNEETAIYLINILNQVDYSITTSTQTTAIEEQPA